VVRLTLALGGLAASNILLAFAYQWYVFTQLGTTRETDALFAAMVVPQLVIAAAAGAMTSVFVPLLVDRDEKAFQRDLWTFFAGSTIGFGAIATLLAIAADAWVPLTVPGFDEEASRLTAHLVRIQLVGMVFLAQAAVLRAGYNARRRFVWAEASVVLAAAVGFGCLAWGLPRVGVTAAAWAFVIKAGLQVLLLLPVLRPFRVPDWRAPAVGDAWRRLKPVLVGTLYSKLDPFADRFLTSMAPAGELSLLHLAQQIYTAGHQVIAKAVGAPMVTDLATRAGRADWHGFRRLARKRLWLVVGFTCVVLAGILVAGSPVLMLLFGHGRIEADQVGKLRGLLLALAGLWVGFSAVKVLQARYYAIGDTRTPMRVGVFTLTIGIVLKALGFYLHGVVGVALATSAFNLLNAALLYLLQRDPVDDAAGQGAGSRVGAAAT